MVVAVVVVVVVVVTASAWAPWRGPGNSLISTVGERSAADEQKWNKSFVTGPDGVMTINKRRPPRSAPAPRSRTSQFAVHFEDKLQTSAFVGVAAREELFKILPASAYAAALVHAHKLELAAAAARAEAERVAAAEHAAQLKAAKAELLQKQKLLRKRRRRRRRSKSAGHRSRRDRGGKKGSPQRSPSGSRSSGRSGSRGKSRSRSGSRSRKLASARSTRSRVAMVSAAAGASADRRLADIAEAVAPTYNPLSPLDFKGPPPSHAGSRLARVESAAGAAAAATAQGSTLDGLLHSDFGALRPWSGTEPGCVAGTRDVRCCVVGRFGWNCLRRAVVCVHRRVCLFVTQ